MPMHFITGFHAMPKSLPTFRSTNSSATAFFPSKINAANGSTTTLNDAPVWSLCVTQVISWGTLYYAFAVLLGAGMVSGRDGCRVLGYRAELVTVYEVPIALGPPVGVTHALQSRDR